MSKTYSKKLGKEEKINIDSKWNEEGKKGRMQGQKDRNWMLIVREGSQKKNYESFDICQTVGR